MSNGDLKERNEMCEKGLFALSDMSYLLAKTTYLLSASDNLLLWL